MNKNIEHYLFHKENFLDEKYCENCINELDKCIWKQHEWYDPQTDILEAKEGDREPKILHAADPKNKSIEKIHVFIIDNLHSTLLEYVRNLEFDWFGKCRC